MLKRVLFRGAATTSSATVLYTVPTRTSTDVKNVVVCNTSASPATFDLSLDGVRTNSTQAIDGYTSVYFDLEQTLEATKTITGGASAITVNFHISGIETV